MSIRVVARHHTVMGQSFIQWFDALIRHRDTISLLPAPSRPARRGPRRAHVGACVCFHAGDRAEFEHCGGGPVPHGDGTVVYSVTQHAQPTPSHIYALLSARLAPAATTLSLPTLPRGLRSGLSAAVLCLSPFPRPVTELPRWLQLYPFPLSGCVVTVTVTVTVATTLSGAHPRLRARLCGRTAGV